MIFAPIPSEVIASGFGALVGAVIALAVFFGRNRERLAKIEEWIRLHEKQHNGEK